MPNYRVVVYGSCDGLLFEDLIVTYSSGYRVPLRVKQGNIVPIEIFDPLDITKSLAVGSLGNYIRAGAVKIEYSDAEKSSKKRKSQQKSVQEIKPEIKPEVKSETPSIETSPIVQQKLEEPQPGHSAPIDLKDVKETEDFFKLSFFNRLKFIQNCNDKRILTDLFNKVDSPQLKNNISYKLDQL